MEIKSESMNRRMRKLFLFSLIFSTAFIFAGSSSDVHSPIFVNLSIEKVPVVNESIVLSCSVNSTIDAPNTTAVITIPEGAELVSGNLTGQLDLKANAPVYLNTTIKFLRPGDFTIKAVARHGIDANNYWGDVGYLHLTIGQRASFFTPAQPWAIHPTMQISVSQAGIKEYNRSAISIDPKTLQLAGKLPIAPKTNGSTYEFFSQPASRPPIGLIGPNASTSAPANPGALKVTGHWYYWGQDSDFKTNPNAWLPAKQFLVEIHKASDGALLGSGYTDLSGAFSVPVTNPGIDGFNVVLWTYTNYGNGEEMRVVNSENAGLTGLTGVYSWFNGPYTSADGTFDIGSVGPYTTDIDSRACWLLYDLDRSNLYVSGYAGGLASQGTIAWWPTNPLTGAHYHPGGQIHLGSGNEVASHVVIHEYGHNIMYTKYGGYFPPSGCTNHWLQNCYDPGCGWTEGWADFFCLAVNNDPIYKDPGFSLDLENHTWGSSGWCNGPSCEGRVAGALWDIMDTRDDGFDIYSWGFSPIANVVFGSRQDTFADFWSQWQTDGYYSDASHCLWQDTIDPGINLRPNAPSTPIGPIHCQTGMSYQYSTSADDPREGDQVKYTFDWGDGTSTSDTGFVNSGDTAGVIHEWTTAGSHQVKAKATDIHGAESGWSDALTVFVNTPPNAPIAPSGDSLVLLGTTHVYCTSATDPDGDQVKYTFDWGDGSGTSDTGFVNSGDTACIIHPWNNAGTWQVRAKATDIHGLESSLSSALIVLVNRPPNIPATPTGPTLGLPRTSYSYCTSATDPDGDPVQYTFDWGDGKSNMTNLVNSGAIACASHKWDKAGIYQIKAYATDSRGTSSGWSSSLSILIDTPPNTPTTPVGPNLGKPGRTYSYSTSATDPDGDLVQYTFDWSDGKSNTTYFVNSGTTLSQSHKWTSAGVYQVKALATDNRSVSSGWSSPLNVSIKNDSIGVYRSSSHSFYLDTNNNRSFDPSDVNVSFGKMGDLPVIGDWNGDSIDELGVFRPSTATFFLDTNANRSLDSGDATFKYGQMGDLPVAGDWNGGGKDDIGIFRRGMFYLDTNGNRTLDAGDAPAFNFGRSGDLPVAGDWNGDGKDEVGVFRQDTGVFYLDYNGNRTLDSGDATANFGKKGDTPVAGDWNGDGKDEIGVFRAGMFYLDYNGNGSFDSGDVIAKFGFKSDMPVAGIWS